MLDSLIKNMVDNFEKIIGLIDPYEIDLLDTDDIFYTIMIVQRQKDNYSGVKVKEGSRKTYLIRNVSELEKNKEEIISLCETLHARAYINLSPKSFTKVQKELLVKLSEYNLRGNTRNPYRILTGVIGETKSKVPRWVIDIDDIEKERDIVIYWLKEQNCEIYGIIPTKTGLHIITKPFNSYIFANTFPDICLHKNSMGTVLYIPESINTEVKIEESNIMQKWMIIIECGSKTEDRYFAYCKNNPVEDPKYWGIIGEVKNLMYEDYCDKIIQEYDEDMEEEPSDDELWADFENDLRLEAFKIDECEDDLEIIIDERE